MGLLLRSTLLPDAASACSHGYCAMATVPCFNVPHGVVSIPLFSRHLPILLLPWKTGSFVDIWTKDVNWSAFRRNDKESRRTAFLSDPKWL